MAIKLDSVVKGIESSVLLTIDSPGEHPSIGLKIDSVRSQVNGSWIEDKSQAKQFVYFIGEDGPVELQGVVPQDYAVEIPAAWRVVVEAEVSSIVMPAFEKGSKSRTCLAVSVRRVVEVWATPKKCLWKASGNLQPASGGLVMDDKGRIS